MTVRTRLAAAMLVLALAGAAAGPASAAGGPAADRLRTNLGQVLQSCFEPDGDRARAMTDKLGWTYDYAVGARVAKGPYGAIKFGAAEGHVCDITLDLTDAGLTDVDAAVQAWSQARDKGVLVRDAADNKHWFFQHGAIVLFHDGDPKRAHLWVDL